MPAKFLSLFVILFALLLPPATGAVEWVGTVVGIADGDTLTLLDGSKTLHRIRIDAIDAPERSQPYGQRARQSLVDLANGRGARAECAKTDRYGRAVCRVIVDGLDVGLEQVRRGLAWYYVKYAREQTADVRLHYAQAEIDARTARVGLWTAPQPIAPWDYRRENPAHAATR